MSYIISCPIRQCPFHIWKFTLCSLHRRPTSLVHIEVLVFLPEHLGHSAAYCQSSSSKHASFHIHAKREEKQRVWEEKHSPRLSHLLSTPNFAAKRVSHNFLHCEQECVDNRLTANFGLFNGWIILMIETHSPPIIVRQGLSRRRRCSC